MWGEIRIIDSGAQISDGCGAWNLAQPTDRMPG
jgi:hypothetical protein